MWNSSVDQDRTKELWKAIASRYSNRNIIAGYDLINEPAPPSDSALIKMYNDIIDSVRTVDNNHMIFLEGKSSSSDFSLYTSLLDSNSAFEVHFYSWFISNIGSALHSYTLLSQTLDAPIWCGEWGENSYSELDSTLYYLRSPSFGYSGECFWTWKKEFSANAYPYYAGFDSTYEWNKSIKWIGNGFAPQPTIAEMQTGIADFITNVKLTNCIFNDTMNVLLQACTTLSANNIMNDLSEPFIFPNPFSTQTTLQSEIPLHKAVLSIYNVFGKKVREEIINDQSAIITRDDLASGLYFVRVTQDSKVIATIKLVITD